MGSWVDILWKNVGDLSSQLFLKLFKLLLHLGHTHFILLFVRLFFNEILFCLWIYHCFQFSTLYLERFVVELGLRLNGSDLSSRPKLSIGFTFWIHWLKRRFMRWILSFLGLRLGRLFLLVSDLPVVSSHSCEYINRASTFFKHAISPFAIQNLDDVGFLDSSCSSQPVLLLSLLRPRDPW